MKLNKNDPDAHYEMAKILIVMGDLKNAIVRLRKFLSLKMLTKSKIIQWPSDQKDTEKEEAEKLLRACLRKKTLDRRGTAPGRRSVHI